jgi:hypothetical protein
MVEFIHGIVALLAGVVLVLTATVAWLYVQQSRMMHAINSLAIAVTAPPPSFMMPSSEKYFESEAGAEAQPEQAAEDHSEYQQPEVADVVDDDRVSVHEVDAPAASHDHDATDAGDATDAIESVQGKTVAQLREMLTAKGIPFNKSDKKPTLISLVQISA